MVQAGEEREVRLIDADALMEQIANSYIKSVDEIPTGAILYIICKAPTIDPVKHGFWEEYETDSYAGFCESGPKWITKRYYHCSGCHKGSVIKSKYCPACGARMDANE